MYQDIDKKNKEAQFGIKNSLDNYPSKTMGIKLAKTPNANLYSPREDRLRYEPREDEIN